MLKFYQYFDTVMFFFHVQHGETAIHLVAKYNHANVIAAFASFKVNVNIGGKVKK